MIKRILVFTVLIVSLVSVVPVSAAPGGLPSDAAAWSLAIRCNGEGFAPGLCELIGNPGDGGGMVTPMGAEYPNPIWRID